MATHGANSSAVDILYLVRTAGAHHTTRLPAVLSTWAAALPRLLVVSERDDATAAALVAKRGGRFVVAVGCGGDHTSGLCCKTWAALRAAWRERAAFTMFADDDALIFAPNLARTLAKLPDVSGATPYYLGNAWCRSRKAQIEDGGPNICGGGGYVLSRGALAKLDFDGGEKDAKADPLVRACSEYSTVDDAALNLVMAKVGVLPTHCNAFHYSFARDATAPHRPRKSRPTRSAAGCARELPPPRPVDDAAARAPRAPLLGGGRRRAVGAQRRRDRGQVVR